MNTMFRGKAKNIEYNRMRQNINLLQGVLCLKTD